MIYKSSKLRICALGALVLWTVGCRLSGSNESSNAAQQNASIVKPDQNNLSVTALEKIAEISVAQIAKTSEVQQALGIGFLQNLPKVTIGCATAGKFINEAFKMAVNHPEYRLQLAAVYERQRAALLAAISNNQQDHELKKMMMEEYRALRLPQLEKVDVEASENQISIMKKECALRHNIIMKSVKDEKRLQHLALYEGQCIMQAASMFADARSQSGFQFQFMPNSANQALQYVYDKSGQSVGQDTSSDSTRGNESGEGAISQKFLSLSGSVSFVSEQNMSHIFAVPPDVLLGMAAQACVKTASATPSPNAPPSYNGAGSDPQGQPPQSPTRTQSANVQSN